MKTLIKQLSVILLFSIFFFNCNAQKSLSTPVEKEPAKVFTIVEEMPQFPGGEKSLAGFIQENIKYPERAKNNKMEGIVYVAFVVNKDGTVSDAKILRGINKECDDEALRVINMMPQWEPGKQNGRPIAVQYNVPVKFFLDNKEIKEKK